jgi:alginate export protein
MCRAFGAAVFLFAVIPAAAQGPPGAADETAPPPDLWQQRPRSSLDLPAETSPPVAQFDAGAGSAARQRAGQAGPPAGSQPPTGEASSPFAGPAYQILREEEDWSFLRNPASRRDRLDPIKYIPFGAEGKSYLTLGGDIRQMFEVFHNEGWGGTPVVNNDWLLQRYMFHADVHVGSRVRGFVRTNSGVINGRVGGPRQIVDNDRFDFNAAWLDLNLHVNRQERPDLTLRVGRQEMYYGSGRLVSVREGINIRNAFDGLRLIARKGSWRVDTFLTKPVITLPGVFDDRFDHKESFWGTFATGSLPPRVPFKLDLYYLGLRRKEAGSALGIAPEMRHTTGGRIWKSGVPFAPGQGWDYDLEGAYQFGKYGPGTGPQGSFGRGDVRAWTFSSVTGYTWDRVALKPRIGLSTGAASGDKDPTNPDIQTFFTPFPNGYYFGAIQQNGPLNIQGFRPNFTVFLPNRMMVAADTFFFWRQSLNDALYGIPGFPLRPAGPSRARYIGTQSDVELSWPVTQHVLINAIYAQFLVGRYLEESPPGKNLRYFHLMLAYQF